MAIEKKLYPPEDKPKPNNNVIQFPVPEDSPLNNWHKANRDKYKNKKIASVEDLAPYLTNFYSEKELLQMSEEEIKNILQDLLDKGLI
jgi:hypothetical protein